LLFYHSCINGSYYFFTSSIRNATTLVNGRIILNENSKEDTMALEKYAFSNALALSGKSHYFGAYHNYYFSICSQWPNKPNVCKAPDWLTDRQTNRLTD